MKLRRTIAVLLLFSFPTSLFGLTLADEKKYGREVFVAVARSAQISSDPYASIYLGVIKNRLESAADLPLPIKLTLIRSETLDAFATVGGYVFVTEGMLEECEKEEEIAGVLAHEFGHVGKRHVAKNAEKEKVINWGMMATMLLALLAPTTEGKAAVMTTGLGAGQAIALKYSREAEEEADRVGQATTEKAGYSGLGSGELLKKLRASGLEKTVPQYLLTHPYSDDRIMKLEQSATLRRTVVDDSFFPFVRARAMIVGKPLGAQNEDIWLKKYQRDPANPVNAYGAALVYSLKGDTAAAESVLRKLVSPYRKLFLGELFSNGKRFQDAVEMLGGSNDPVSLFFLAKAYEGLGNSEKAGSLYRKLLPFAGSYPEIYQRLAMVLGKAGDDGGGYEFLGRYYLETGKDQAAKMNLEKAISKYGINAPESKELLTLIEPLGPKKGEPRKKGEDNT
jgi:beta-barrel assembly-enhancing protease